MTTTTHKHRLARYIVIALFVISLFTTLINASIQNSAAAGYSMQTGYYIGNGAAGHAITGLGFQPDLVIIKAENSTTQTTTFKTSAMPATATVSMGAVADSTTSDITFAADGFTLGSATNVNSGNLLYTWTAFTGSDCTSSGSYCVGTYTGTGVGNPRSITSLGFQPDILFLKRTNTATNIRTSSMPTGRTEYLTSTAADTTGLFVNQFISTGFEVGASGNFNGSIYYFIAFKSSATTAQGSYIGDGTDDRDITGLGFTPNFTVLKNSTSATATSRRTIMSSTQSYGDYSNYLGDAFAGASNNIQNLQSDGFQVGSSPNTNESGQTMYWMSFGGAAPNLPSGSGTYKMATGTYTGTGVARSITGLGFKPDLVIVKSNGANYTMFRTSLMTGDATAYLAAAAGTATGAITSINTDGFSLGTTAITNTNATTYHWQAFGNAYNPETRTGSADFAIGSYIGSAVSGRTITATPFQMDFVAAKTSLNSSGGVFRTSAQSGDTSSLFAGGANTSSVISSLTSTGFQLGANAATNSSGVLYYWFGFKASSNFAVGSYQGTGINNHAVTLGPGMQPSLVFVKQNTATNTITRPETLTGDASQYTLQIANATNKITSFTSTGMTLGTGSEVNTNNGTYWYASWRIPSPGSLSSDIVDSTGTSVVSPNYSMSSLTFPYACSQPSGQLGDATQRIRVANTTGTSTWSLSIAATGGPTSKWATGGSESYDFNDPTSAGCADGSDTDTAAGQLTIDPSGASIAPKTGCNATGLSLGASAGFNEGVTNAITLVSANSSAATSCYWDITNVGLRQTIPAGQAGGSYQLNLTVTAVSS